MSSSITFSVQDIITLASILAAIVSIITAYNKGYNFVKKQHKQDEDLSSIKKELGLLSQGVLACLKGLKEQGCDGPVTVAIADIESFLNEKAHE